MNIFITGGTSGLGLNIGKLFEEDGHHIGVCSFESPDSISSIPSTFEYYQADVTDQETLSNVIHEFASKNGSLDLVIANAGITMDKARIPDFPRARKVVEINILGVLNTFEPSIEIMKEQGNGHLVGIGSLSGINGLPGMATYGATKSFIINFCESLEIDLDEYGIHVTTFAPGFIKTALTESNTHKMPFLMSLEKAAQKMKDDIVAKKGLVLFPFPTSMFTRLLYYFPRPLYKWFMKKDPLGMRK